MSLSNDTFVGPWRHDAYKRPLYTIVEEDATPDPNDQVVAGGEVRSADGHRQIAFTNPPAADIVTRVAKLTLQASEETFTPIFDIDPVNATAPKFSLYLNSAENPGAGAGTYNRGVWMGFNAGRYLGGTFEAGKQGVYMGFEDNYFDSGGDETHGVEWYMGYTTPDGSTIGPADLRPFYMRVKDSATNTPTKSVFTWIDIGEGTDGNFSVMGGQTAGIQLFVLTKTLAYHRLPSTFTANNADAAGAGTLRLEPTDGYAALDIVAPGTGIAGNYAIVNFKVVSTYRWSVAGTTGSFEIQDSTNGARLHVQLVPGASDTLASTILKSSLKVNGNVGFYGTTPVAKPTGVAVTAAGVHAALVTLGLIAA